MSQASKKIVSICHVFAKSLIGSGNELIAHSIDGHYVGLRVMCRKFLTECQDLVIHRSRGRHLFVAPDFLEELLAFDHLTAAANEEFQNLKFLTQPPNPSRWSFHSQEGGRARMAREPACDPVRQRRGDSPK